VPEAEEGREIDVRGAVVIFDITTNDVRGTRSSPRTSPMVVAERVGTTIDLLVVKECTGVVICEVKPIHFRMSPHITMLFT
jgi:hypothetical protein